MARTFELADLVQLPRLDAASAYALTRQILTAADAAAEARPRDKLPAAIAKALKDLAASHEALGKLLTPTQAKTPRSDPRIADRAVDNAIAALENWLAAFLRLPEGTAEREQAQTIYDLIFAGGLGFIRAPFRVEWTHLDRRIKAIRNQHLDRSLAALGGGPFLKHLHETFAAYGAAIGVTAVPPAPAELPQLRPEYLKLIDALRAYVLKVSAHVEPDDPDSQKLAAALLRPLTEFEVSVAGSGSGEAPPAPPSPAGSGSSPGGPTVG